MGTHTIWWETGSCSLNVYTNQISLQNVGSAYSYPIWVSLIWDPRGTSNQRVLNHTPFSPAYSPSIAFRTYLVSCRVESTGFLRDNQIRVYSTLHPHRGPVMVWHTVVDFDCFTLTTLIQITAPLTVNVTWWNRVITFLTTQIRSRLS